MNNDTVTINVEDVDLSRNLITEKSIDILKTLCEENHNMKKLNISKNKFKSKLSLKVLNEFKDKTIVS